MLEALCYFMMCVIAIVFMIVICIICDIPKHLPKKNKNRFATCAHYSIYKAFMDMIVERKLQPYTLVMSYEQIISMLNVPELNIRNTIINPCMGYIMDDAAFLLIYAYKHYKEGNISGDVSHKYLREKNGLILFLPKSYRDYRKLCRYFANLDISQTNDNVTEKQMESLKYLTDLIHQAQDKYTKTLQGCQTEMDREIRKCKAQSPYFRNRSNSANEK